MSNKYQPVPENLQQDSDGLWRQSVPLPFYGVRKGCHCGKKFWKESNYESHYINAHTDGLRYKRDKTGIHAVERIHV